MADLLLLGTSLDHLLLETGSRLLLGVQSIDPSPPTPDPTATEGLILSDPILGDLTLRGFPFTVVSFQIGSRAPRVVSRSRALADGAFDDTKYAGGRAVTISLMLNEQSCGDSTMQDLYDLILPYFKPSRRPVLSWSLPGSGHDRRQMTVRGDSAPVVIGRKTHPVLVCSFVSPDGEITSVGDPSCITIKPSGDVESGRTYDLDYTTPDRVYPDSLSVGDRIITNAGNEDAHWVLTIFGPCTNPFFKINGITISFTRNGGLELEDGSSVIISTREKTVYLNGSPTDPRYDRTNFTQWSWGDILLGPKQNLVRFGAEVLEEDTQAVFCSSPTWAG